MIIQTTALTALAASEQVERIAERVSRAGLEAANPAGEVVDLSEEMVKLLGARTAFQAAVKVIQVADEIAQHSLDLLA